MPLIEKLKVAVFGGLTRTTEKLIPKMRGVQRLILPMIDCRQVVGYKNAEYRKYWGFVHYGWDFNSSEADPGVFAQGEGEVKAVGKDSLFGNTVVVVYKACELHSGSVADLTVRYFHLLDRSICVKAGDHVLRGQRLATMGNTGRYTSGAHLHITIDTDVQYPCYEPGIARSGNIIKRGTDSTVDPAKVLWIGEGQKLKNGAYPGWNRPEDYNLPKAD